SADGGGRLAGGTDRAGGATDRAGDRPGGAGSGGLRAERGGAGGPDDAARAGDRSRHGTGARRLVDPQPAGPAAAATPRDGGGGGWRLRPAARGDPRTAGRDRRPRPFLSSDDGAARRARPAESGVRIGRVARAEDAAERHQGL